MGIFQNVTGVSSRDCVIDPAGDRIIFVLEKEFSTIALATTPSSISSGTTRAPTNSIRTHATHRTRTARAVRPHKSESGGSSRTAIPALDEDPSWHAKWQFSIGDHDAFGNWKLGPWPVGAQRERGPTTRDQQVQLVRWRAGRLRADARAHAPGFVSAPRGADVGSRITPLVVMNHRLLPWWRLVPACSSRACFR